VIEFAVTLSDLDFARMKQKLSVAKIRAVEFVSAVAARRKAAAAVRRSRGIDPDDGRPEIMITVEEGDVNANAVAALAQQENIYQRAGELVRVIEASRRKPGEEARTVADVRIITEPLLRELLARAARWSEWNAQGDKKPSHPPDWCVRAVRVWHSWPDVPPLYHVAEAPVLFENGRVLQAVGYDHESGILCRTKFQVELPRGPEWNTKAPNVEHLRSVASFAAAELLELVSEFPFENDEHRSAWLAALLTAVGRWAFSGQAPMFAFDANKEGIGKGLLAWIIAQITLGRGCDLLVQTADEEEERKRITSKIISAQPIVLIDECDKPFGSPALQALLTTGTWSDRLLGSNDSPSFDVSTVWFAAGNNFQFKSNDIRRRTCLVRLVTREDRPEQRTGFKIANMDSFVAEHRPTLFRSALLVLRAWLCSGLKAAELDGWGGTWGLAGTWDQVVRGAIVFAGLPDPIATKATSVEPVARDGMLELIVGLSEAVAEIGTGGEITTAILHNALTDNDDDRKMPRAIGEQVVQVRFATLRKGLHSLLPQLRGATPSGEQFGKLLGKCKQQGVVVGETEALPGVRRWIASRWSHGAMHWRVEDVDAATVADPAEDFPR
jgi:hypothetical protein